MGDTDRYRIPALMKPTAVLTIALLLPFVIGCRTTSIVGDQQPAAKRVLLVTGVDYPGHKWRQTAPVLAAAIGADPRLDVTVTEHPADLAGDLSGYDAVVLHFMDWKVPDPGPAARANLQRFVRDGGGLVLVHFACGAFQDWPDFVNLAGRVWDPKLRGHDPYGRFIVRVVDPSHPTMQGLTDFETVDELYTCLAGDVPIHVVAAARSKVDGKDYPMAFVLRVGQGRVFHCVLGHDAQAIANAPVAAMFRNGTAWTAGLVPGPHGQGDSVGVLNR